MEANNNDLSPEERLALIKTMINKTKDSVADGSFYFLLWVWLVFGCCLSAFILKVFMQFPYHYMVWCLMPVGGIVSWIYGANQSKTLRVKSFVDEALDYLWIALGLAFFVLIIINMINGQSWQTAFTYYILLYAIGTFVSGSLLRFKPLVIGGLINFVLAAVCSKLSYDYQLLIGALAILISYIIPGHLLRIKYKKQKK